MKLNKLSLFVISSALVLCGCGENPVNPDPKEETPVWKNDNSKHWHQTIDAEGNVIKTDEGEHTFAIDNEKSHQATCKDTGELVSKCTVCGMEKVAPIGLTDHTYGEWEIDSYAQIAHDASGIGDTITSYGKRHKTCSVCGDVVTDDKFEEEKPLEAHSHTYTGDWQYDDTNHWKQCTYGMTTGYGGKLMYVCPEKSQNDAHTWDDGVITKAPTTTSEGIKTFTCTVCGGKKTGTISPIVDHTDGSESITVNFNKLEGKQAATVNPKTKAYLDAMKSAEKSLKDPYAFQDLDNGVNVENYLNKNDYKDSAGQGHNKPDGLTLSWEKGTMDYASAIVKYATKADMSDALEVATTGNSVKVNNLYSNTKYYYQLTYTKNSTLYKSNIETFETADYIRFIDMGLVYNVRDMGGYKTSYGGRVKQGLIYRGSELTPKAYSDSNGSHPKNIDDDILSLQKNVLKIKVEIDHRSGSEAQNLTTSPINTTEIPVEYRRDGYKFSAYEGFLNASNSIIQNLFNAFAEASTKPVYFHCIGGADRTGSAAYVLLGLLGVSYSDVVSDFEVTTETNYPRSRYFNNGSAPYYSRFPDLLSNFKKASWFKSTVSFKENCEAFLKSKGVTDATIEKLRKGMIEGYGESGDSGNTGGNTGGTEQGGGGNQNPTTHSVPADHTWSTAQKVSTNGCVDLYSASCTCGKKKVSFKATEGTLTSGSTNNNTNGYLKLKSNGNSISYTINLPEAINGKIYFYGCMDSWPNNGSKSYFSGNSTGTTNADKNGNFTLKVDGTAIDFSAMKGTTYSSMFTGSGSTSDEGYAEIGAFNFTAGQHSVVFTRVDSYNVLTKEFVIIY